MTKVLNFYGGPGVGKSTTATGVFSALKLRGVSCEYVNEYAKEITWEGTQKLLENQLHVFAEQTRRQWRLVGQVDYIITDSPLLLATVYLDYYNKSQQMFSPEYFDLTKKFFFATFDWFKNVNFVIRRNKQYVTRGRNQTAEQAGEIDTLITKLLAEHQIEPIYTDSQAAIADVLAWFDQQETKGQ